MTTKRLVYRLMLLLLCMMGWQPTAFAAEDQPSPQSTQSTLDGTRDNAPQWQDMGMCDVLAVTGGSTLIPPTTVRVVHDGPTGTAASVQASGARHYSIHRLSTYGYCRTVSGYIYLIRCLRL